MGGAKPCKTRYLIRSRKQPWLWRRRIVTLLPGRGVAGTCFAREHAVIEGAVAGNVGVGVGVGVGANAASARRME